MNSVETVIIRRSGRSWRVLQGGAPLDVSFVDVGAALDAALALGGERLVRVVVKDDDAAMGCEAAA